MIRRSLLLLSCGAISLFSCKKSGDDGQKLREMSEVVVENDNDIQAYLKSHYCELDADKNIVLGTLAGNTGKTSLWDNPNLKRKTLKVPDIHGNYINHTMYYLILQEGAGAQATIADRSYVLYKGLTLKDKVFEDGMRFTQSNWMDLLGTRASAYQGGAIIGFREAVATLKASTAKPTEVGDGTLKAPTDGGMGIFFLPSGLAYFAGTIGLPAYPPLIFEIKLISTANYDHDGDGKPSIQEINHQEDGTIVFPDCNGNGTVDYLDAYNCN